MDAFDGYELTGDIVLTCADGAVGAPALDVFQLVLGIHLEWEVFKVLKHVDLLPLLIRSQSVRFLG